MGNNGMGGQGVLPLPIADHGWIEETAKLVGSGKLTAEVEGWLKALTKEQKEMIRQHVQEGVSQRIASLR